MPSTSARCGLRSSCSGWSPPESRAFSLPPTRSPVAGGVRAIDAVRGLRRAARVGRRQSGSLPRRYIHARGHRAAWRHPRRHPPPRAGEDRSARRGALRNAARHRVGDRRAKPWIVQSRAITTLYPIPEGAANRSATCASTSLNVAQGVLRPFTPMGLQTWRLIARRSPGEGRPPADPAVGPSVLAESACAYGSTSPPCSGARAAGDTCPRVHGHGSRDSASSRGCWTIRGSPRGGRPSPLAVPTFAPSARGSRRPDPRHLDPEGA